MKKFLALMLLALSAFLFVSCGGEEDVKCEHDPQMSDLICPDKRITVCATESGDQVWIKIDDKKYKCDGGVEDDDFCENVIQKIYNECHNND